MKNLPVVLAVAFLLFYFVTKFVPGGDLIKPTGPDMVLAFSQNATRSGAEARRDAKQFGALCNALADDLEFDWAQPDPQLNSGAEVDNLRIIARKITTKGESYAEHYPALKEVLKQHFAKHIDVLYKADEGTGGPLDEPKRRAWLNAFRELAACSNYAGEKL